MANSGLGSRGIGSSELSSFATSGASFTRSFQIIPNDDVDLETPTRTIFLGCPGTIKYTMVGGDTRERLLPAGYHPLKIKKVFATGTDIPQSDLEGHV